jgi:RNA polymerase sigma-70 factor (ECF subfamily)
MNFGSSRERNRREFDDVILPHVDGLYGTALRLTRNERDAEDLVQDAVLRAFRFFHRFERGTNAKAWLFKILTNTFVNKYRKKQRERSVLDEVQADDGAALHGDHPGNRDPETVVINRLMSDHVKQALEELPEEFRLAVVLADLEDFSYREIADIMECPIGTVMSRLYRGRRALQRLLTEAAREQGVLGEPEPARDPAARLRVVKTEPGE